METVKEDIGKEEARGQLESIKEMVTELNAAEKSGNDRAIIDARQNIQEAPLSVTVRSGWESPGTKLKPWKFEILFCINEPVVRIIGELNEHSQPDLATLEYQNWSTPWAAYPFNLEDEEFLLNYCQEFYFGE